MNLRSAAWREHMCMSVDRPKYGHNYRMEPAAYVLADPLLSLAVRLHQAFPPAIHLLDI